MPSYSQTVETSKGSHSPFRGALSLLWEGVSCLDQRDPSHIIHMKTDSSGNPPDAEARISNLGCGLADPSK